MFITLSICDSKIGKSDPINRNSIEKPGIKLIWTSCIIGPSSVDIETKK